MEASVESSVEPSPDPGPSEGPRPPGGDALPAARVGLRPPSDEVRASLAAIQAARSAAQVRLKQDSHRVRLLTLTFVAASIWGAFAVVRHLRAARHAPGAAGLVVAPGATGPSTTFPPSPVETAPTGVPTAAELLPSAPASAAAPESVADTDAEATAARAQALAACTDAYEGHRWRTAAETCAAAFEASPRESALAMKVAQAQHARAHYADAGAWAQRAIALEGADPEAFVILAHAERRAGHPAAARAAYRRYLSLAPRGWHASEARAALRRSRPEGHLRAATRPDADPAGLGQLPG
jgi:hypothetical protein